MQSQQSAGYLMNHIARQFAMLLTERLQHLGLAPAQFPILLHLWEKDGLTQHELVALTDLRQATIANTLARMERDGLIVRETAETDARIRLIKLTEHAQNLQHEATQIANKINQQALSPLSKDEQAAFLVMAQKIMAQQKIMIENKK